MLSCLFEKDKKQTNNKNQQHGMCHNVTNNPKDKIFLELRPEVKVTVI